MPPCGQDDRHGVGRRRCRRRARAHDLGVPGRRQDGGGRFPTWSFDDLQEVLPDETVREQMVRELHPRGLDFFTEPIPVFKAWPDAPCIYIRLSAPYEQPAAQARQSGWPTYRLDAGHFHMLADPIAVTDMMIEGLNKLS